MKILRSEFSRAILAKLKIALTILLFILVSACTSRRERTPGICLSFDDHSVREWYDLMPLFRKYNAKVTFFISHFDSLSDAEIGMLKEMQDEGHEIGSHGALHVVSENYIHTHGYKAWLKNEIDGNTNAMRAKGFDPVSFAYPYGAKYWFTDLLLLDRFKILRGVSALQNHSITKTDEIYFAFDHDETVSALGIDKGTLQEGDITDGIEKAISENKVLLLMGHKPDVNFKRTDSYSFDPALLEFILKEATEHHLTFYRVTDLAEY
jgi:peptidoglycan/xylan/chitin deacetylase (PgdA/CDA1 family)